MRDAERAYSGALLEFFAYYERAIEELFLGLIDGRVVSGRASVRPLASVTSPAVARKLVFGGRSYADWLPYDDHLKRRAKLFFAKGDPFTRISETDRRALGEFVIVRNALAHQSRAALKLFEQRVIGGRPLPPREQKPEGYLRGIHTAGQTRMNLLLITHVLIFQSMSK